MSPEILAEKSVLGGMMVDNKEYAKKAMAVITEDHFTTQLNKTVWRLIAGLYEKDLPIDLLAVWEEAKPLGIGNELLTDVLQCSIQTYDEISCLHRIHLKRQAIKFAGDLKEEIKEGTSSTLKETLTASQERINKMLSEISDKSYKDSKQVVKETFKYLEKIYNGEISVLTTGLVELDRLCGGFMPGDYIVVAAEASQGKSSLALRIAYTISSTDTVAYFSFEMPNEQIMIRLISMTAGIDSQKLRDPKNLKSEDFNKIHEACSQISKLGLVFSDKEVTTVRDIRAKCEEIKSKKGLGLVVLDYLQLITPTNEYSTKANRISEMSRQIKLMATSLKVPVIVVSQLRRNPPGTKPPEPLNWLSRLKDSSSIEQDANMVIFIYELDEEERYAELGVEKNRDGKKGLFRLLFRPEIVRFDNLLK